MPATYVGRMLSTLLPAERRASSSMTVASTPDLFSSLLVVDLAAQPTSAAAETRMNAERMLRLMSTSGHRGSTNTDGRHKPDPAGGRTTTPGMRRGGRKRREYSSGEDLQRGRTRWARSRSLLLLAHGHQHGK